MRHRATNPARDSQPPATSNTEADRPGIRSLDCGHEVSQDGDLTIRRTVRAPERDGVPIELIGDEGATSFGEQQQAV